MYLLAFLFLVAHALFWPALFILDESEGFIFAFNQISIDLTDKQIVGGREHFWNDIIDYINQSAMSGFGIHRSLVDVNGSGLSSHNYYLQVLLQTGYVGLSLLILLIASVWGSLFRLRGQVIGRAAMAVFAGVTVLNIFEVILTQNHLIFGVVFWFVLGVANGTTLTPTESKKFVVNYR